MLVYTEQTTSRLRYILDYVFSYRLGLELYIENDIEKFKIDSGFKINYSHINIPDVFQIIPNGLLYENTITETKPDVSISNNGLHFYSNEQGDLKFDIFSACFWLLSRYEEYQSFEADDHGRFISTQSYGSKHEFLLKPVVDEWILEFKSKLQSFYGDMKFKSEVFKVIPTIDIDSPWCYKHKGITRNIGGFFRDWMKVNFAEIPERLNVLLRLKQDAHFQFDWLKKLYAQLDLKPIYFILVGEYGNHDKTISQTNNAFKAFLKDLCVNNEVGIHPSYNAADKPRVLESEFDFLNSFQLEKVTKSRQHFLKFTLPEYYEMLLDTGIKHDYSMGFADYIGFRAGTSRPFKFYNLQKEEATDLTVHPFSIMDVSVAQYMKKTKEEALLIFEELINSIKKVNGEFVSLWHNESLSDRMEWKGWRSVYTKMLNIGIQNNGN